MMCNIFSSIKPKELEWIMKPSAKYSMRLRGTILIINEILRIYLFGFN